MKETKTYLRKRWKNEDFINKFSLPLKKSFELWNAEKKLVKLKSEEINNIDLRGISDDELWFFSNLSDNHNIDFYCGSGSLNFYKGECTNINFKEFKFDRATSFHSVKIINCNFNKSKLIFNATDTIFESCDFSETTFRGGFNEYGFRRCTFINCTFNNSQWNNIYLLACKFKDCKYTDFKIYNAKIGGFKVNKLTEEINNLFVDCEINGLIETKI